MTIYLLRYYDWDWEGGYTCGVFPTMTDALAYIVEYYEGRTNIEKVTEPVVHKYGTAIPYTDIEIDGGDYGKCLVLERLEMEADAVSEKVKLVFVNGGEIDEIQNGGAISAVLPNPTNGDRIRAKTDEELAEWICEVQDGDAYQKENYLPPLSKSWWLKWLKQEADHA